LQGRHRDVALPDAAADVLARLPRNTEGRELPVAGRDKPGLLAAHVDAARGAKAEALRHRRELVDAEAAGPLVEIAVAATLDTLAHVERAVPLRAPAMPDGIAELEMAGAADTRLRRDSGFERRERHHRLERRARRVGAADGLVAERVERIPEQLVPH